MTFRRQRNYISLLAALVAALLGNPRVAPTSLEQSACLAPVRHVT